MTIYVYGIDLAQSLNYTAIIITKVENKKITIVRIKKYNKMTYPELEEILFKFFEKYKPTRVVVDYTNERSFAETIEAKLHPSFMNSNSSDYKKWKTVMPVVFSQEMKLELKQNAREIMEKGQFVWPNPLKTDLRVWPLIEELKSQMLKEAASPGRNGLLNFLKPAGYDNDLIIAHELNLYGAKEFLHHNPEDWGIIRPYRHNPMLKYLCDLCKKGNHPGTIHQIYFDPTGGQIDCPCPICNGTETPEESNSQN